MLLGRHLCDFSNQIREGSDTGSVFVGKFEMCGGECGLRERAEAKFRSVEKSTRFLVPFLDDIIAQ